jgi:hypothetical protein
MNTHFTEGVLKEIIGIGTSKIQFKISPTANFALKFKGCDYMVWISNPNPIGAALVTKTEQEYDVTSGEKIAPILAALVGKHLRYHMRKGRGAKISLISVDII